MLNRFLIVFFISSNIFSQTQVVIVEEMLMDVPFAGEIKYTTTKYASDNLFKRDMEIEVGSFLVRMAMGGNKKLGEFIDGNKKMRTVYDLNEEEYAQENFQTIIDNDGKPTLEIPLGGPMGGGGGGNSNNEDDEQNEDNEDQVDEDEENNEVRRVIEKGYEKIGEFSTKKVTTEMMGSRGRVIIEEWFTTDTSLFRFAIDVESKLASAYGGKAQTFPRSFSESMLRRAGHEFESVEGRVVKYQMSPIDDDGFKMGFEIKINKQPFKKSDFSIPTKWEKVDELN
ncbi:MAG: hypothetical protein CM1200mP1_09910 [Candidatus Neomarinimicrobiota bacterium]|nr:MAG: hypothetical protein CM1200mP1_09910 [Candidatus Neomarinimicrobiota bacterium]